MQPPTTPPELIVVVEDNHLIAEFTVHHLRMAGFTTATAASGEEALHLLRTLDPALIVLDVVLGDGIDGFEVCRRIRQSDGLGLARIADVPIIMLTARAEDHERIDGFNAGADDYVVKPFNPNELCARIGAVLRRHRGRQPSVLQFGDLQIDLLQRVVSIQDSVLDLTPKEFDLLHVLATNQGKAVARTTLLQRIWGYNTQCSTRTLDVHVQRLREKLATQGAIGAAIETEWGVGYRMVI
jgi:DNA-binding response OmpR family regulator